jgi:hypothetical protein
LLEKKILEPSNFSVFLFKYTDLMTTWMIRLKIYDRGRKYSQVKPLYLKAILSCFEPWLTDKGKKEYEKTICSLDP